MVDVLKKISKDMLGGKIHKALLDLARFLQESASFLLIFGKENLFITCKTGIIYITGIWKYMHSEIQRHLLGFLKASI